MDTRSVDGNDALPNAERQYDDRQTDPLQRFQVIMAEQAEINSDLSETDAGELAQRFSRELREERYLRAQSRDRRERLLQEFIASYDGRNDDLSEEDIEAIADDIAREVIETLCERGIIRFEEDTPL